MNLWIRTQDKTTLIRSYEIYIVEQHNTYLIRAKRTSHVLGAYRTFERALEVLDEIQRLIEDLQYISYAIENEKFSGYRPNVYQMPKE